MILKMQTMLNNYHYVHSYIFSQSETNVSLNLQNYLINTNFNKNYQKTIKVIISKLLIKQISHNDNYLTLKDFPFKHNDKVEQLKTFFPAAFQDGVLNFDILKQELSANQILEEKNYFGLHWNGKIEAKINGQKPLNFKTLKPLRNFSVNFDQAQNLIIEGNNLEALKILQNAYLRQVDVVYIDPPYNTDNDFIYNDKFKQDSYEYRIANDLIDSEGLKTSTKQNTDGRIHSNWLNMMYPRLMLARQLLKDEGIIFISIDHKEQAHLKMICNEIFHESNFVTALTWVKKHGPGGNTSFDYKIINNTEYILCYAKNINQVKFNYLIHDQKRLKELGYINKDEYFNERGYYKLTHLYRPSSTGSFQYTESLDYPIMAPDGTEFRLHCNKNGQKNGCYTWSYETYLAGNKLGFIECHKNNEGDWVAFRKQYQFVKFDVKNKAIIQIEAGQPYENLIDDFYSQEGGAEIREIFGDKNIFDFPKPKRLIKYLLKMATNKNALVLDFFAGSGTTGQAVMELNQEDGGNRQYILIQLNEPIPNSHNSNFKNICEITRARIERSIERYQYDDKGFKYFKVVPTNFQIWQTTTKDDNEIIEKQLDLFSQIANKQNDYEAILYELMLKSGMRLDWKIESKMIDEHQFWIDEQIDNLFFLKTQNLEQVLEIIKQILKEKTNDSETKVYISEAYFAGQLGDQKKLNLWEQIKQFNKQASKKIKMVVV